jgi:hypothetical protein
LYQRWTTVPGTHPREAFVGLAVLLHAAAITAPRWERFSPGLRHILVGRSVSVVKLLIRLM